MMKVEEFSVEDYDQESGGRNKQNVLKVQPTHIPVAQVATASSSSSPTHTPTSPAHTRPAENTHIQQQHSPHHHHGAIHSLPITEIAVHSAPSLFTTAVNSAAALVEPMEFYSVRTRAKPKAPGMCRILTACLLLFTGIGLFIYVLIESIYSYSVETDIFQIHTLNVNEWDQCLPTTTLGSNWAPLSMTFLDDCNSLLKFKLSNVWYPDVNTCIQQLNASTHIHGLCELTGTVTSVPNVIEKDTSSSSISSSSSSSELLINGTMCWNTMPFYPDGEGFIAYSCNGIPLTNCTRAFATAAAKECSGNFIELTFDYSMKWMHEQPGPQRNHCYSNIVPLCEAIFASGNPYKCTRKKYMTILASIANAYSFSTLIFSIAVAFFSVSFSIVFSKMNLKEIEISDDKHVIVDEKKQDQKFIIGK